MTSKPEWTWRHATELRNHWWWRPGWVIGTRYYAFHLAAGDEPELARLVSQFQRALEPVDGLDLIPRQWLHITMQGVSFVEDLTPRDLEAVLSTAQEALSQIEPFTVRFDRPVIRPEAIVLAPDPVEPLSRLKQAIRQAIATAVGDDVSDADAPEYQPHVSFAYVSADQSPAAVLKAIDAVDTTPAELRIDTVPLIEMHRDNRMYEWRNLRTVQLGTSVPSAAESRPSTDVRQMSAN